MDMLNVSTHQLLQMEVYELLKNTNKPKFSLLN